MGTVEGFGFGNSCSEATLDESISAPAKSTFDPRNYNTSVRTPGGANFSSSTEAEARLRA